ncbi:hypothetical protein VTK26DRAFT_5957 [Humicola hyalothermophila]
MRCLRAANALLRTNAASSGSLARTASPSLVQQRTPGIYQQLAIPSSPASWQPPLNRFFSHTSRCERKKNKDNSKADSDAGPTKSKSKKGAPEPPQPDTSSTGGSSDGPPAEDIFDLTPVTEAFNRAEKRFLEELKKLRTGGRFNADAIGAIPVQPDRRSPQTFPLRELATVAPLGGRRWSILAFEEESVKAILSAVQRSDGFNQQPQRSDDNPLELTMTVEPERADALARRAKEVCQAWRTRVRDESHRRAEAHKKARAEGLISKDELFQLKNKLQKLQDERMKGIADREKEVVAQIMAKAK